MADDDPTTPQAQSYVVGGEAPLPDEHTARVRARQQDEATVHKVHDTTVDARPATSTELAESSRKARRRERDRRAERRAMQWLVAGFVGLGGIGLVAVNVLIDDTPSPASASTDDPTNPDEPPPPVKPPPRRSPGVFTTAPTEAVDIPAIRQLRADGLTIAAEGLPEVIANGEGQAVAPLAALETCRFAFSVWEFSPNRRFRFMTTCAPLEGQILYGAYEIRGGKVHMSPLTTPIARITSVFDAERPASMKTKVESMLKGEVMMTFEVNQRVTVMRAGLHGEGFHDTYRQKNTITLHHQLAPGRVPTPPSGGGGAAPPPPTKKKSGGGDPLLDLLKGQ
ncbi:MAG: hypothetical protein RMA76_01875 [Deltaproteobacteria bacterium]|jgi:hypothetical protein